MEKTLDVTKCINCKKCTEECAFLSKYDIVLGDKEKLWENAYSCFLCGRCGEVCPVGIDGKEVVMNYRKQQRVKKGYGMLLLEKQNYLFRNEKALQGGAVFFPGCNFTGFYPKTTKAIAQLLWDKAGMATVYDCCGKPIQEIGLEEESQKSLQRMTRAYEKAGVTEFVTACPNCYYYLKSRVGIKVTILYEKLVELNVGTRIDDRVKLFSPCPDRYEKEIYHILKENFLPRDTKEIKAQCCGLGGMAGVKEPELADAMATELAGQSPVYVYCASCAGNLKRHGATVRHVASEILGIKEDADASLALWNRIKKKFE